MIKNHTKAALIALAVFLGAGAWAQFSGSSVSQNIEGSLPMIPALAGRDVSRLPDFNTSLPKGELLTQIAQAPNQQTAPVSSISTTPAQAPASQGFTADMSPEALKAEIAAQILQGKDLETVLRAARTAGVQDGAFASAAAQAGVSIATITTTVITLSADPAGALATLGKAFAGDPVALAAVFTTAVTISSVTLSPAAVGSAIEAGCGQTCLPAAVVAAAQASTSTPDTSTSNTGTTTGSSAGSGSGGNTPISPS